RPIDRDQPRRDRQTGRAAGPGDDERSGSWADRPHDPALTKDARVGPSRPVALEEGMTVSPGIFRQYDIRGIVGKDLTVEAASAIGRAYASLMRERSIAGSVVVSRDNRPSGPALRDALVDGLTTSGVEVVDIGEVPTPLNYWALNHLKVAGGIQITGSHNPPEYNGFKLSLGTASLHGEEIQRLYALTREGRQPAASGRGSVREEEIIDRYIDDVVQ